MQTIAGTVDKFKWHNDANTGCIFDMLHHDSTDKTGAKAVRRKSTVTYFTRYPYSFKPGDDVIVTGEWQEHPKYGKQIKAKSVSKNQASISREGLFRFLSENKNFKNVGKVRADAILDRFGPDEFVKIVMSDDDAETVRLAEISGITTATALVIRDEWRRRYALNDVIITLAQYELSQNQIDRLIDCYEGEAINALRENPYILIDDLDGWGFLRADKVAEKIGIKKKNKNRFAAALKYQLDQNAQSGHTLTPRETLIKQLNELLKINDTPRPMEWIAAALDAVVGERDSLGSCCFTQVGNHVGLSSLVSMEKYILDVLRAVKRRDEGVTRYQRFAGSSGLSDEQNAAVDAAMQSRISVITGPAGTGKTRTLSELCAALASERKTFLLAAPTGKAAKRIEEATSQQAKTIHRLLEHNGMDFQIDEDNPLSADFVIIDEASMIDVSLCYALFRAINFSRTSLVLVGDHNQLPAVGAGNILRDIIHNDLCPVSRLKQVHRNAGDLLQNANAVLGGVVVKSKNPKIISDWNVITHTDKFQLETYEGFQKYIVYLYTRVCPELMGLDPLADVQVMSPTHKGPLGCSELNAQIQSAIHGKTLYGEIVKGDKVIQTKNDYSLGVMNGALGVVKDVGCIGPDGIELYAYKIKFQDIDEPVLIPNKKAKNVSLAYALTVHKMQGSEVDCVIVVAHKSHSFMNHRNLLYTAVTRAKKNVIIVGDSWGVKRCASKVESDKRCTVMSVASGSEASL